MGEGFIKQKRKAFKSAIIKSAVCGLSFGLFCVGVILLALKLSAIKLFFVYYVLIAIGAALLCGGIAFLIFKLSDKKLAKKLDNTYGLQEKVQTALAFAEVSGEVVEIQRTDAEARLNSLPKDKFNIAKVWQYFLIGLLAVTLFFTAVFIPAKVVEGEPNDQPDDPINFSVSEEQLAALDDLIENINDSQLTEDTKQSTVSLISELKEDLKSAELQIQMQTLVTTAANATSSIILETLSYMDIANSLAEHDYFIFADIIASGVRVYREYSYENYSYVEDFALKLKNEDLVYVAIEDLIKQAFDALEADEEFENTLANLNAALRDIIDVKNVSEDDGLYKVFRALYRDLADEEISINLAFINFSEGDLCPELETNAYIRAMKNYIIQAICTPFGVEVPDDKDFQPSANGEGIGEDDRRPNGGYGDGNNRGASDDLIYDPATGEYVRYIDILSQYEALVDALLREEELTQEQMKLIRSYFDILRQYVAEE